MTTFNEALAAHGSAEEAIRHTLKDVYKYAHGNMTESFGPVAQWVLANAAAIHQYQSGTQNDDLSQLLARIEAIERGSEDRDRVISIRLQKLEDAPGPRPNADEVSALRRRIDYLVETLAKLHAHDTSDVLKKLVGDVQHIKKWAQLLDGPKLLTVVNALHKDVWQLKTGQSADPQPVATPEPEPVYEWHGNSYGLAGNTKGLLCYGLDSVIGVAGQSCKVFDTEAAARSWVEAQIKTPKP